MPRPKFPKRNWDDVIQMRYNSRVHNNITELWFTFIRKKEPISPIFTIQEAHLGKHCDWLNRWWDDYLVTEALEEAIFDIKKK